MRLSPFAALFLLAGCAWVEPPADPAGLTERPVEIGGHAVTLLVPPEAQIVPGPGGRTVVRFEPDSRAEPTMTLSPRASPPEAFPYESTLESRATLHYDTRTDDGGGSGGPVSALQGRLETFDGPVLGVECTEQRETPHPSWCVAYLHHIRPAVSPARRDDA